MSRKISKVLEENYFTPTRDTSYSGATRLLRKFRGKIDENEIIEWLRTQDAYTLHRPVRYKFPRLHYNVPCMDAVWEGDLVDLRSIRTYNDNHCYILTLIDVLSKFAWCEPMVKKSNQEFIKAFGNILKRSNNRQPVVLQTDKGKEFVGQAAVAYLKSNGIQHQTTRNPDVKCAIVERFNRTLKERMWRYFTHKNTKRYVDVLQDLVCGYNRSRHSTIKMSPMAVTLDNQHEAKENMDKRYKVVERTPKYSVGDIVRISKARSTFGKGYEGNWTEELFRIVRVLSHRKPPVYEITDLANEYIDGIFYEEELNPVSKDLYSKTKVYKINEILKTSGKGPRKKYFVSWIGYPSKFNSWVLAKDISQL